MCMSMSAERLRVQKKVLNVGTVQCGIVIWDLGLHYTAHTILLLFSTIFMFSIYIIYEYHLYLFMQREHKTKIMLFILFFSLWLLNENCTPMSSSAFNNVEIYGLIKIKIKLQLLCFIRIFGNLN